MAEVTRVDKEFPRVPADAAPTKRGLRSGGPSMNVPGDGGVRKAKGTLPGNRAGRSAVDYADAMSSVGGPADSGDGKRVDNK